MPTRSKLTAFLPLPATSANLMVVCPQMPFGEIIHAVTAAPGIEHVGDQHGVVDGRRLNAVTGQEPASHI